MRQRLSVVMGAVLLFEASLLGGSRGRDQPRITERELVAVKTWIGRASNVFVGTLRQVDFRWSCTSGLAPCYRALDFEVVRSLKGELRIAKLRVEATMLGASTWADYDPSNGVRLAEHFFVVGNAYIVLAEVPSPRVALPLGELVVTGSEQIWPASNENVRIVEGLLDVRKE